MSHRGRRSPLLPPATCLRQFAHRGRKSVLTGSFVSWRPTVTAASARDMPPAIRALELNVSVPGSFVSWRPTVTAASACDMPPAIRAQGVNVSVAWKFCLMEADGHRCFRALFNRANSFKQRRMVVVEHRIDFWRHYFGKIFAVQFYECR